MLRLWALLLIPIALSTVIAGDWIRMLAYAAVVFVPIAAQHAWTSTGAILTLGATAVSAIGVQKMDGTWMQVVAGAAVIVVYAILGSSRSEGNSPPRRSADDGRAAPSCVVLWAWKAAVVIHRDADDRRHHHHGHDRLRPLRSRLQSAAAKLAGARDGEPAHDPAEHVGGLLANALYRVLPIGRSFGGR